MSEETVTVRLTQRHDFQFDNQFGAAAPALLADEPAPLGQGAGPSPVRLLAAAVGNCLSASLLFSLRKLKQTAEPLACEMQAQVGRAADKHLRVLGLQARLTLGVCRALGRACVEAGNGLSLGAMHSHALRHGAQWQRRISPLPASTRRAGAIFGAIRRCRLVVGGNPTPRRRLG